MKPRVTDKDCLLKIEDQLCFALYSTSRAITKQYASILDDLGLTYPQYLALMVLWAKDGLLVQELAKQLELEPATTTPLVRRLENLELVTRQRSVEDERRVHVYLTAKGRKLYKKALDVPRRIKCSIGVSEKKAAALLKEANKIKRFIAEQD